jgi:NTE family protein
LGHRHVDRRDQRRDHRRQSARSADARLETFWDHVRNAGEFELPSLWPGLGHLFTNLTTVTQAFRRSLPPRPPTWGGINAPLGVDAASYYATEPLRETLGALVDFGY